MIENAEPLPVSIILTAYNSRDFLVAALNSVAKQNFPHWEMIVVDDGSHEESRAFIRSAVQGMPHTRLVRQSNRGLSAARNFGVKATRGELLAFMDHDDIWEPDFLEKMTFAMSERPTAGAVFCRIRHMTEDGSCTKRVSNPPLTGLGAKDFLVSDPACSGSAMIVRRNALEQVGGFDEAMLRAEMPDFFIRLIHSGWQISGIPDVLVHYRNTPGSLAAGTLLRIYRRRIFEKARLSGEYSFFTLLKLRVLMEINQVRIQVRRALVKSSS